MAGAPALAVVAACRPSYTSSRHGVLTHLVEKVGLSFNHHRTVASLWLALL